MSIEPVPMAVDRDLRTYFDLIVYIGQDKWCHRLVVVVHCTYATPLAIVKLDKHHRDSWLMPFCLCCGFVHGSSDMEMCENNSDKIHTRAGKKP